MTWTLRIVDLDALRARGELPRTGDMWFADWYPADMMSEHYRRDHAGMRPPIIIRLPDGDDWCPDRPSNNGSGWTVTGEAPRLTATPSILSNGGYHGFLCDGVLTDDVSGRQWPAGGTP